MCGLKVRASNRTSSRERKPDGASPLQLSLFMIHLVRRSRSGTNPQTHDTDFPLTLLRSRLRYHDPQTTEEQGRRHHIESGCTLEERNPISHPEWEENGEPNAHTSFRPPRRWDAQTSFRLPRHQRTRQGGRRQTGRRLRNCHNHSANPDSLGFSRIFPDFPGISRLFPDFPGFSSHPKTDLALCGPDSS